MGRPHSRRANASAGELSPDQRRTLPGDHRPARIHSLYVHDWATRRTCCVSPHKATNTLRNRRFGRLIGLCAEKRVDHAQLTNSAACCKSVLTRNQCFAAQWPHIFVAAVPQPVGSRHLFSHGVQGGSSGRANSVPAVCKGYPSLAEGKRHGRTWWFRIDRGIGLRRRINRQGCGADLRRSCARGLPLRI
jgi:hypothetical protein